MSAHIGAAFFSFVGLVCAARLTAAQNIHEVAQRGDTVAVARLLAQHPDLVLRADDHTRTPLHFAAASGSRETALLLLAYGADVDARDYEGETALHYAAVRNRARVVDLLLNHGADTEIPNAYGRTPLLLVARETGNVEVARLLIDRGADPNARDRSGETPLALAAWRGFAPLVELLLDRGVEVPTAELEVQAVTGFAVEKGLPRLFHVLANAGADLGARNDNGGSLLHSAAAGGSRDIVEALLERGLAIGEPDRYGRTPLHYAAEYGHLAVVELLVDSGASLDARSAAGYSAYNMAQAGEHEDAAQLLATRGADTAAVDFPMLHGPYLGQPAPGAEPVPFALDIVASHRFEHCVVTFSPDGDEAFWSSSYLIDRSGYSRSILLTSAIEEERWTEPTRAAFSQFANGDGEPFFHPDGSRLFFLSARPSPADGTRAERIWYVDRTADGWSEPQMIEGGPNTLETHWQFSVAADGTIYFGSAAPGGLGGGDIYRSGFLDGRWQEPETLGAPVNSEAREGSPFIAPDGRFLIFASEREAGGVGGEDLYVSFRDEAGNWAAPVNLGEPVSSASHEVCAVVTPDGGRLVFNSFRSGNADIYWIDAGILEELRPPAQ